jgi:hypothetical protein
VNGWLSLDELSFAGVVGAGIRIAVIDSGVAAAHPHVGAVARGTSLVGDDPEDTTDRIGHGTAVFAAIRESAPQAELIPIRVLDRQLATSARLLAQAIDWAVDAGAHVVNLSFGTTNEAHVPLFELSLAAATAARVVVVAPHSHDGRRWFPGSLHGAVGVVADAAIPRFAVAPLPLDAPLGTALAASPYPRPIDGVPVERNLSGVSFAVANATGVIARALAAGVPPAPLHELLAWIAERTLPPPTRQG